MLPSSPRARSIVARTPFSALLVSAVCGVRSCAAGWVGGCATGAGSCDAGGGSTGFGSAGFSCGGAGRGGAGRVFPREAVGGGAVGNSATGSGSGSGAGSMTRGGGGGTFIGGRSGAFRADRAAQPDNAGTIRIAGRAQKSRLSRYIV